MKDLTKAELVKKVAFLQLENNQLRSQIKKPKEAKFKRAIKAFVNEFYK